MKAIINGKVILPNAQGNFILENCAVLFDDVIKKITPHFDGVAEKIIDANGKYVSPGFINVHIHGCGGADTMDDEDNALKIISKNLTAHGVTSFLPTTMTYDIARLQKIFCRIRKAMTQSHGAKILGCHMEGPYISEKFKGAQAEKNIRQANFSDIKNFTDVIKIITLAPEKISDWSFVEKCQAAKIILSIGHSAATYEQAMSAVEVHKINHFTHTFNAMTGFHHRRPGVVGAALDSSANCEIIPDNIHTSPAAQRIFYHAKQGKNIILITDSLRACGLGDGESELGGQKVFVKGNLATLADGTIAGSVIAMNQAVKIFLENTKAPLPQIIEMVTKNPAQELNFYDKIGSIEEGKQADFVIFDDDLKIFSTIIDGNFF